MSAHAPKTYLVKLSKQDNCRIANPQFAVKPHKRRNVVK